MGDRNRPPIPEATRFIGYLQQYRDNRGALADLRAAFSDGRRHRAWPLLGPYRDAVGDKRHELVAALWAADPEGHAADRNMGATLRSLASENNSFEGRFKRILTATRDEVPELVAPLVRAAQAKGGAVHYARLLSDLICWGDWVKAEWAKAFWGTGETDAIGIDASMLDAPEEVEEVQV